MRKLDSIITKLQDYRITRFKRKKIEEERLIDLAYELFCENLERIRNVCTIKTICAHGSPLSPFDNRIIWGKYDYRELGLIGEPSFDVDWNEFAYFTDTGRCWNGNDFSVRDKVESKFKFKFKSTQEIIDNINLLPENIMFNIHPQRWHDNFINWEKEFIYQSCKNVIKKYFFVNRGGRVPEFLVPKRVFDGVEEVAEVVERK